MQLKCHHLVGTCQLENITFKFQHLNKILIKIVSLFPSPVSLQLSLLTSLGYPALPGMIQMIF